MLKIRFIVYKNHCNLGCNLLTDEPNMPFCYSVSYTVAVSGPDLVAVYG